MKKLIKLSALIMLLSFFSCSKKAPDADKTVVASKNDNSRNSLDWPGIYTGMTPCPGDCSGINTSIEIREDYRYSISVQAMGQEDEPRVFKGSFIWDKTDNIITLDAEGDHLKFKVQEGSLLMLDKFGDPKQDGRPEEYVLSKQAN
jgi:uncharacterized lipoprotein NlpE involved in copper resistance